MAKAGHYDYGLKPDTTTIAEAGHYAPSNCGYTPPR
jgi:hypothetical protein